MKETDYTIWDAAKRLDGLCADEANQNLILKDLHDRLDAQGHRIRFLEDGEMRRLLRVDDRLKQLEREGRVLGACFTHEANTTAQERFARADRVTELENKMAEYLINEDGEIHPVEFVILDRPVRDEFHPVVVAILGGDPLP